MSIKFKQLSQMLKRKHHAVIVLSGDEAQLLEEGHTQVASFLENQGFDLDQSVTLTQKEDGAALIQHVLNPSLFSEKRFFLVHAEQTGVGRDLADCMMRMLASDDADQVLVVCAPRIPKKDQYSDWYKAVDASGLMVSIWPLNDSEWLQWAKTHCHRLGLQCEPDVLTWLQACTEGHLSAAQQSLEKLHMTFGSARITLTQAKAQLFDQAEYQIYDLMAFCMSGQVKKTLQAFAYYQKRDADMNLLSWAIAKDLSLLLALLQASSRDAVYKKNKIWPSKQQQYEAMLRRVNFSLIAQWLQAAALLDASIKGLAPWLVWQRLHALLLAMVQRKPCPLVCEA